MFRIVFPSILATILCAGGSLHAGSRDAHLTKKEIAAGWLMLFDGTSTFGWTPLAPAQEEVWTANDGVLAATSGEGLRTLRHYGDFANFVLCMKVAVPKGAKGGILVRADEPSEDQPTPDGFLVSLPLPRSKSNGTEEEKIAALDKKKPHWRNVEILCVGDHTMLKIDGKVVRDRKGDRRPRGWIGLQQFTSGKPILFRDIKLRPLRLTSIFNGKDLKEWAVIKPPASGKRTAPLLSQRWRVVDGSIKVDVPEVDGRTKGGRGALESKGRYADFILQLDVRTNGDKLNSGVFFRNIPGEMWAGYETQIRNEWEGDDRTKPVDYGTGGIYRRVPARKVVSSDNAFFTMTIAASGRTFLVWVDGYPVTCWVDPREPNANPRSGFSPVPGTIQLQSHDPSTDIDFRNIRVSELPTAEPLPTASADAKTERNEK